MKKNGEYGFVWLFAIFAGIAILVFAIYGAIKVTQTQSFVTDTEIAKQLTILTDPVEAGFAQTVSAFIGFSGPTRIRNRCDSIDFGSNYISVSTESRGKWSAYGVETGISDKYIFSPQVVEGERVNIISEKFSFPFKVSDVLVFVSDSNTYCFTDAPEDTKMIIDSWKIDNIATGNCSEYENVVEICFGKSGCDISVYGDCKNCNSEYEYGTVVDSKITKQYSNGLMFAAIFSDSESYSCNVKRLLYRTSKISEILSEKISFSSSRGCHSNLASELSVFKSITQNATMKDLPYLQTLSDELSRMENGEACGLW
jgi:hypothetical protein